MNQEEIIAKLQTMLDQKRFLHTLGVRETALELAALYQVNQEQAAIAALLHDCAKNLPFPSLFEEAQKASLFLEDIDYRVPQLLHGPVGALIAHRDFGVTDEAILQSIRVHTLGSINMSDLDKIIYIADMIEPSRKYNSVKELRELASLNLEQAIISCIDASLHYVINNGFLIHPQTIDARNFLIWSKKEN